MLNTIVKNDEHIDLHSSTNFRALGTECVDAILKEASPNVALPDYAAKITWLVGHYKDQRKSPDATPVQPEEQPALSDFEKDWTTRLKAMLKASKTADNRQITDIGTVALDVQKYVTNRRTFASADSDGSIKADAIKTHIYDLAGYLKDASKVKSAAFEMRIIRGIRNGLLAADAYNPHTNKRNDHENGYHLDANGVPTLPFNIVAPIIKTETPDGTKVKGPNSDNRRVPVNASTVQAHYSKFAPGTVKARTTKGKAGDANPTKAYEHDVAAAIARVIQSIGNMTPAKAYDPESETIEQLEVLNRYLDLFFIARCEFDSEGEYTGTNRALSFKSIDKL